MTTSSEQPLKIVIVGHVDHGKSTLVGRLFYETDSLPEGKLDAIKATCQKRGVPFEWAFLMDALQAERDQNITIDTAQIWFRTPKRPYVIIDAPGHREFIKNMVTGAADADAAFLLIAADEGVQEQSRRHGYLLSLLGIRQVVVLVNKMDLVSYDQATFDRVEAQYREFLSQINVTPAAFVPISAREGDHIAAHSRAHMPWYDGPTVVEALDAFKRPGTSEAQPLRLPIQDIYRFDHRRILSGRIETGEVKVGDVLRFEPGGRTSTVKSIERWSAVSSPQAQAGESVGITLTDQIFVERGHMATLADAPQTAVIVSDRLRANLFWLGQDELIEGKSYKLKLATQEVACHIERITRVIDASSLETKAQDKTRAVQRNDAAELILRAHAPIAFDLHADSPTTGRFVIVDGYDVCGGGIIVEGLEPSEHSKQEDNEAQTIALTPIERFKRNRHRGAVVMEHGLNQLDHQLMVSLERALHNRGFQTYLLTPRHDDLAQAEGDLYAISLAARSLAAAGVVCLVSWPALDLHGLRTLRALCDDATTSSIVVHAGAFDAALASSGERASADDVQAFGDADIIIFEQHESLPQSTAAIVEQLTPYLQRF